MTEHLWASVALSVKTEIVCFAELLWELSKIPNCLAHSRCAINASFLPGGFYVESREMTSSLGKNGHYSLCRWNSDKDLWETPASPAWPRKQVSLPALPKPSVSELGGQVGGGKCAGQRGLCTVPSCLDCPFFHSSTPSVDTLCSRGARCCSHGACGVRGWVEGETGACCKEG